MDHEYSGMGEEHLETQDYIDSDVEYISTEADNVEYVPDSNVSDGTDFDLPHTYPPEKAVPYEDPMSQHQRNVMDEIDRQYEPTRAVGVAQDTIQFTKDFAQGNEAQKAEALSRFSKQQLSRFTSPKVIGPLLLLYAYRGRLSYAERFIWGAVGLGAAINAYGLMKPNKGYNHPLMKTVRAKVSSV